jgi:membrane-bound lytic murein transglycosylase B
MKWIISLTLGLLISFNCFASQKWRQFVNNVRQEALAQGVRASTFDRAFRNIREPSRKVLKYDRTQPEKRLTFLKYRNTRADAYRIKIGRKKLKKNFKLISKIGQEYGVSPCFIASFWGLETSYGHFMGKFPVIQSLATLAFDSRRSAFFRKELLIALHILDEGHVDLNKFKGEWAGATGQPQFLPSSWKKFAVDYNGNGKRDIWVEKADIFASIANYLRLNGWQSGGPWAIDVRVPSSIHPDIMTRKIKKHVQTWLNMGVNPVNHALPRGSLMASVIRPYGGPSMMIFNNFNVIMRWNRSTYYAGTVGYLAEKICRRKL